MSILSPSQASVASLVVIYIYGPAVLSGLGHGCEKPGAVRVRSCLPHLFAGMLACITGHSTYTTSSVNPGLGDGMPILCIKPDRPRLSFACPVY